MKSLLRLVTFLVLGVCIVGAWKDDSKPAQGQGSDKVLLRDVSTLTLYAGKMTNARRSRPVSQLKCLGGTANCKSQATPQVMQCYNKGWDGSDVNWECKSELDKSYKLGPVEVSCEGYEYPDDPYILKGSCGAEYKLDLTAHGQQAQHQQSRQQGGGWFGGSSQGASSRQGWISWLLGGSSAAQPTHKKSWFGGTGTLATIGLIIFVVYKKFIAPAQQNAALHGGAQEEHWYSRYFPQGAPPARRDDHAPPPYGFNNDDHAARGAPPPYDTRYKNPNINAAAGASAHQAGSGGGGFWQGALGGAAAGYFFGNRGQRAQSSPYSGARATMNETSSRYSSPASSTSTTTTHTSTSYGTTKRR